MVFIGREQAELDASLLLIGNSSVALDSITPTFATSSTAMRAAFQGTGRLGDLRALPAAELRYIVEHGMYGTDQNEKLRRLILG